MNNASQSSDPRVEAAARMLGAEAAAFDVPDVRWYDHRHPEVSIIILNYNKSALTADCLRYLWANTTGRRYEIVVVDNGSDPAEFQQISAVGGEFRLIRLAMNRFFGEGNNIGVEGSRGKYVVFLNNDAFVTPNWLTPLIDTLDKEFAAGGVGPKFLYPDGRLQEAGAIVEADGSAIQRGKYYAMEEPESGGAEIVDYCSAACFAVTREIFDRVSGFDATYEPAYYEDTDLCMKIASLGRFVYYHPRSVVVHIENATTSTSRKRLGLENIIETNRAKFLRRWGGYLAERAVNAVAAPAPLPPARPRTTVVSASRNAPVAVFHTPYELIPGGGERYMLTAASALIDTHRVYVATECRYSQYRLDYMARALSLDLAGVSMIQRSEFKDLGPIDVFFELDNHQFPVLPPQGRRNYFMCQFPFPLSAVDRGARWNNLAGYDCVLVNSSFTSGVLAAKINTFHFDTDITILPPPVPIGEFGGKRSGGVILNIGRFFAGGHNKRHDILIEAAKKLLETGHDVELHLIGSLHNGPEHIEYVHALQRSAQGFPIRFHFDASADDVRYWLSRASLYWHATGFAVDPLLAPEMCEHFGISVVEAMAAGCVPFVVANGGPPEFVREGETGFQYSTVQELVDKTRALMTDPRRIEALAAAAARTAVLFSERSFMERWRKIALGHRLPAT